MRNQGQLFIGLMFIFAGMLFLATTLFNINAWAFCWPLGFILLGVWLIARPQMAGPDTRFVQQFIGDIKRDGAWQVEDTEFWSFIGDVDMDMTLAQFAAGETTMRLYSFIGDVRIYLPADVGITVTCSAFINDVKILDEKQEGFLHTVSATSSDYETAEHRLRLEVSSFIGDVKVRRIGAPALNSNIDALKAAEKEKK
jgi:predicted membrane protein